MNEIRELIRKGISNIIKEEKEIGLLLSGGIDSLSVLLGCLDLGIKPTCYSFYLSNHISDDIISCRKLRDLYNLNLVEFCINSDEVDVLKDVKNIVKKFKDDPHAVSRKKTFIQCYHPMTFMVKAVTEKILLTAFLADNLQFTGRKKSIMSKDKSFEGILALNNQRKKEIDSINTGSIKQIKALFKEYNIELTDVYREPDIIDYFMGKTYIECSSPKEKNLVYEAYKDELDKNKLRRIHSSFQVNSGIREWHHDVLVNNPEINEKGFKTVVGIYNKIFKENLLGEDKII